MTCPTRLPAASCESSTGAASVPSAAAPPHPLADAWCEFLSRWPWDWFTTHTFRFAAHPERADKVFRVWISKLNRELYGVRWHRRSGGLWWARASEPHKSGRLHFHALVGGPGLADVHRPDWMDCNAKKRGIPKCGRCWYCLAGFARIEPPNSSGAVRAYCSKYVTKGGLIDLGGPLRSALYPPAPPRVATHRGCSAKLRNA